jgi:hypothetical protein
MPQQRADRELMRYEHVVRGRHTAAVQIDFSDCVQAFEHEEGMRRRSIVEVERGFVRPVGIVDPLRSPLAHAVKWVGNDPGAQQVKMDMSGHLRGQPWQCSIRRAAVRPDVAKPPAIG